ncbi:unnamed protein product [Ambrosiozyma monospora]|uniref:Unnamed protein product n=1 Tax=Ambrosiozyma monospora TaxID=43982 RepID=A0ACB5T8T7_AMBMO|nr:unnamed protein product [Ambrosiozyma monospora]
MLKVVSFEINLNEFSENIQIPSRPIPNSFLQSLPISHLHKFSLKTGTSKNSVDLGETDFSQLSSQSVENFEVYSTNKCKVLNFYKLPINVISLKFYVYCNSVIGAAPSSLESLTILVPYNLKTPVREIICNCYRLRHFTLGSSYHTVLDNPELINECSNIPTLNLRGVNHILTHLESFSLLLLWIDRDDLQVELSKFPSSLKRFQVSSRMPLGGRLKTINLSIEDLSRQDLANCKFVTDEGIRIKILKTNYNGTC